MMRQIPHSVGKQNNFKLILVLPTKDVNTLIQKKQILILRACISCVEITIVRNKGEHSVKI